MELSITINITFPECYCAVESPIQPYSIRYSADICTDSPEEDVDINTEYSDSSKISYKNSVLEHEREQCGGDRCYV